MKGLTAARTVAASAGLAKAPVGVTCPPGTSVASVAAWRASTVWIESAAASVYAVKQALQPVLEDRVDVEVERLPDDVAEPGIPGRSCLPSQVAVVVAHPLVRWHPGVLRCLRFGKPGKCHAAHVGDPSGKQVTGRT